MEFRWTVLIKTEETTVGQNATPKITIVVEEDTEKQYKESVAVDFIGDEKVANARTVSEWDTVEVKFNLSSSEYNWKYYNNIRWWFIKTEKSQPVKDGGDFTKKPERIEEDFEDLPFR